MCNLSPKLQKGANLTPGEEAPLSQNATETRAKR